MNLLVDRLFIIQYNIFLFGEVMEILLNTFAILLCGSILVTWMVIEDD